MTTLLVNRIGVPPSTKRAGYRLEESPTAYDNDAIARRILFVTSDEERLYGPMSYSGAQAEALRQAAAARRPLPEAPRPVQ